VPRNKNRTLNRELCGAMRDEREESRTWKTKYTLPPAHGKKKKTIITRSNTTYSLTCVPRTLKLKLSCVECRNRSLHTRWHRMEGDRIDQSKSFLIFTALHCTALAHELPNIVKESYTESKAHLCLFMND
jgi:hypothetical protein